VFCYESGRDLEFSTHQQNEKVHKSKRHRDISGRKKGYRKFVRADYKLKFKKHYKISFPDLPVFTNGV